MDLKTTALFAGFGSIGLLWGQIKSVFSRLSSVIIVSADLVGNAEDAVMGYCWKNFKASRFGSRRFTGIGRFIKPINRQGTVAFEMTGNALTFFHGWKPLFVAGARDATNHATGITKITFIRGTFDIEKLVAQAVAEYDELKHGNAIETKRYFIRKFFGRQTDKSDRGEVTANGKSPSEDNSTIQPELRPLRWKLDELGYPSSKAPFDNLAYSREVNSFLSEVRRWKISEPWFKERGLPWRFGGGLFGPPGTGKTSFVRAIAQDLDMPIHIYDLTTMNNEELCNFWAESLSCAPCIVLFEDIDRIFDQDKNVKTSLHKSPLTLDCLLNCINGVQASDGILTLITANDPSKLDPALGVPDKNGKSTRPGRLDRAVHFGTLEEKGRIKVAKRILAGFEHLIPQAVEDGKDESGAQFESRCSKIALEQYWNKAEEGRTE